jgi:hypothetical protein
MATITDPLRLLPASLRVLALAGLLLAGCNNNSGGGGNSSNNGGGNQTPTAQSQTADGSFVAVVSAMQETRITMNYPWTSQDLADMGVSPDPGHEGTTFTTWKKNYDRKLAECEAFGDAKDSNDELICVPRKSTSHTDCSSDKILEYGYYCGAGRPAIGYWNKEPLDGVDYCCYLHDLQAWQGGNGTHQQNLACGAVMCMMKATAYPAGAENQFPDMENARQCVHDWAATLCGGNQLNDTPAPVVQYNPP